MTDIETLVSKNPETIIAGTGASGLMIPSKDLQEFLRMKNIEFLAMPTGEAVRLYNELVQVKTIGGCFHLTC